MKRVRSLILTQNLEVAALWNEDPSFGHSVAVLPALPQDQARSLLWKTRFPSIELLDTPAQALEWAPDVVIGIEPGYSALTDLFRKRNIAVVNSSSFLDRLGLDPETSRNAITSLFQYNNSRRFIPLHQNPLMVQSETLYYALRYPEDSYILDIGDLQGEVLTVKAPEILHNTEEFTATVVGQQFFANRIGGMLQHREGAPQMLFKVTCIHSATWVGNPILSWEDGVDKVACWLPFQESDLVHGLGKLAGSWKVRGTLTLECCLDPDGGVQVYRIAPGMPTWLWAWLRLKIADAQSWASLWSSVGHRAVFDYQIGDNTPGWLLEAERDSGLHIVEGQCTKWVPGFEHDFLMGASQWWYSQFDLTTLGALQQICMTGLTLKKPMWAAIELGRVAQYLKSWEHPSESVEQPGEVGPPIEEEPPLQEPESEEPVENEVEIKEEEQACLQI